MTEEKKKSLHPISKALCAAYNALYEKKEVSFILQDEQADKLDVIVKTIYGSWFGVEPYPTYEDKAAAFLYFIIKDHPVVDGNKRLSVLWLEIFCDVTEIEIDSNTLPLDELAVSVEKTKDLDQTQLIKIIKNILFHK